MSDRLITRLAAFQALDAVVNTVPSKWLDDDFARLRIPGSWRPIFPVVKGASSAGLLVGLRRRGVGRLTAACLVLYFILALGAHARVKDHPVRWAPAVFMLGWSIAALGSFA